METRCHLMGPELRFSFLVDAWKDPVIVGHTRVTEWEGCTHARPNKCSTHAQDRETSVRANDLLMSDWLRKDACWMESNFHASKNFLSRNKFDLYDEIIWRHIRNIHRDVSPLHLNICSLCDRHLSLKKSPLWNVRIYRKTKIKKRGKGFNALTMLTQNSWVS